MLHSSPGRFALRSWLGPRRRLRFSGAGWTFVGASLLLGVAAIGTGNNLLFLLLGAMLGLIILSGWLSEIALRGVEVRRRVPADVVAGEPSYLEYELRNTKRRAPSFAVEVGEAGSEVRAWTPSVAPGESVAVRAEGAWPARGVYALDGVTLATAFPFGLFEKQLDLPLPGEVTVWPRSDRPVRSPRLPALRTSRAGVLTARAAHAARGEYRSLREFRAGDDPRDVHWRSTARRGTTVVREYEREAGETLWVCLDLAAEPGERAEAAVEIAAALASQAARPGRAFAFCTPDLLLLPATGEAQRRRVLNALASARPRPGAPPPVPPVPPGECVLVTPGSGGGGWGDVLGVEL